MLRISHEAKPNVILCRSNEQKYYPFKLPNCLPRDVSGLRSEKRTKVKTELIDVDLVRGSTFPKPHPRHALPSMLWFSLLSCVLFPLRSSWWIRHTNTTVFLIGCLVFCSSLGNLLLHHLVLCRSSSTYCSQVSVQELWEPVLLFIVLAFLQCHILSPIKSNLEIFPSRPHTSAPLQRSSTARPTSTARPSSSRPSSSSRRPSSSELRRRPSKARLDYLYESVTSGSDGEGQSGEESSQSRVSHEEVRSSESETEARPGSESLDSGTEQRCRDYLSQGSLVSSQIGCTVWGADGAPSKIHLSALDIGNMVFERSKHIPADSTGYAITGLCLAVVIALTPLAFKIPALEEFLHQAVSVLPPQLLLLLPPYLHSPAPDISQEAATFYFLILTAACNRLVLTIALFFLLSVAERAFKRRFLTAKLFSHLTSSRRSLKSSLPHFRLYKVRNIKAWLCVRSFLRRRGPQRSVDFIVSTAFLICLCNVVYLCYQLLREDKEEEVSQVTEVNCEVLSWCIAMAVFLIRFMTLASKINQKYRNLSVLLTEQINLYLQMELKPHKKEQLLLANNVLKLSSDLLKELETPFKIHGLSANPFLYNVTRLLVLSAVSGVLSEMLGFKLKLYKVKIK